MVIVKVDASDAIRETEALGRQLERLPAQIERRLRRAVDRERGSHAFTNRTGRAEASMDVDVVNSGDGISIVAEMGAEYSSYLERGDWTRFSERVEGALAEIAEDVAKLGDV